MRRIALNVVSDRMATFDDEIPTLTEPVLDPEGSPSLQLSADIPTHIIESIDEIAELHADAERRATVHQRGIERWTHSLGRPYLLYSIVAGAVLWIAVNVAMERAGELPFDPFPFYLLQGMISLSALLIATLVLITQDRQSKLSEKRGHLDLQINLLTERKIAKVIALLEELRRDLPNVRNRPDPEARAMEARIDTRAVADALEKSIEAEASAESTSGD